MFNRYYDAPGNLILSVDAAGTGVERRRASRHDALNRMISRTSATGEVASMVYDPAGNVISATDPAGNATTRVYDGLNRLLSETTPDAGTTTTAYDGNGNVTKTTDASGASTSFAYDAANRLATSTDPAGATRAVTYDLHDNLTALKDGRGSVNSFAYDEFDRKIFRTDPLGNLWGWEYDTRGHAVRFTADNSVDGAAYDALGRVTQSNSRSYSYDAAGNLTRAVDGNFAGRTLTWSYDALNRVATSSISGLFTPFTLTYAYDPLSRRATAADNLGGTTRYSFDGEDRLTSIVTPWNATIAQSYDAAGRPLRMTYPNGLDADLSFESRTGRLASLNHRAGSLAVPLASFAHSYDVRGNLAALTELPGTKSYSYDKLERLTGVTPAAPLPAAAAESYSYDAEGNRTATAAQPAIAVDAANRVLDDGVAAYTWDTAGALQTRTPKANPAAQDFFRHSWQGAANQSRLDTIFGPHAMGFGYDGLQRLDRIYWNFGANGIVDRFHDGDDMVLEARNTACCSPQFQYVRYVHGPGDDQPLAMEIYPVLAHPVPGTGAVYYFHADGEGSVRCRRVSPAWPLRPPVFRFDASRRLDTCRGFRPHRDRGACRPYRLQECHRRECREVQPDTSC